MGRGARILPQHIALSGKECRAAFRQLAGVPMHGAAFRASIARISVAGSQRMSGERGYGDQISVQLRSMKAKVRPVQLLGVLRLKEAGSPINWRTMHIAHTDSRNCPFGTSC